MQESSSYLIRTYTVYTSRYLYLESFVYFFRKGKNDSSVSIHKDTGDDGGSISNTMLENIYEWEAQGKKRIPEFFILYTWHFWKQRNCVVLDSTTPSLCLLWKFGRADVVFCRLEQSVSIVLCGVGDVSGGH